TLPILTQHTPTELGIEPPIGALPPKPMDQALVPMRFQPLLQPPHLPSRQAKQLGRFRLRVQSLLDDVQYLEPIPFTLTHLDPVFLLHAHSHVLLDQWPKRTFLLR